jgi:hypothetical protein
MEFLCYVSALGFTVSVLWLDATGSMTIPTFFLLLLQHFNDSLATCFGAYNSSIMQIQMRFLYLFLLDCHTRHKEIKNVSLQG